MDTRDYYISGDLKIPKKNIHDLLKLLKETYGGKEFLTRDILAQYMGHYHSDRGQPPGKSWNANFGKILKQCEKETGMIKEIKKRVYTKDDSGNKTLNSLWKIK